MLASGGAAVAAFLTSTSSATPVATSPASSTISSAIIASLVGTTGPLSNSLVPLMLSLREEGGLGHHPPRSQIHGSTGGHYAQHLRGSCRISGTLVVDERRETAQRELYPVVHLQH